jgi:hypothetical protein
METTATITNGDLAISAEITERERNVALLGFLPETKSLTLYCHLTGEPIASMVLLQQAGKLPFLSQWKEPLSYHPLFSLPQRQLLSWTRHNWNILFKAASDHVTDVQKKQFQIAFMAILHSLKCLDQQHPALPTFDVVNSNMQRLIELAYWYNWLESKRFRFPTLRINKLNANLNLSDIHTYFDICDSVRHDYETSKEAKYEEAKLEAARRAEKSVAGTHVRAVSKKHLWNWFLSCMQNHDAKKFARAEWLAWKEEKSKLWYASDTGILKHSPDEVTEIEDMFLIVCSLGTTISHAFTNELNLIRDKINNHLKIFSLDMIDTIKQPSVRRVGVDGKPVVIAPVHPGDTPPNPNDFEKRHMYLVARAKYDVAIMQYNAWKEKYGEDHEQTDSEDSPEESNKDSEDNDDDQTGE